MTNLILRTLYYFIFSTAGTCAKMFISHTQNLHFKQDVKNALMTFKKYNSHTRNISRNTIFKLYWEKLWKCAIFRTDFIYYPNGKYFQSAPTCSEINHTLDTDNMGSFYSTLKLVEEYKIYISFIE